LSTPEAFEFAVDNEMKRAVRSLNVFTLQVPISTTVRGSSS
jgi:hypothetical protein